MRTPDSRRAIVKPRKPSRRLYVALWLTDIVRANAQPKNAFWKAVYRSARRKLAAA